MNLKKVVIFFIAFMVKWSPSNRTVGLLKQMLKPPAIPYLVLFHLRVLSVMQSLIAAPLTENSIMEKVDMSESAAFHLTLIYVRQVKYSKIMKDLDFTSDCFAGTLSYI